jgi:hypothetical protein
MSNNLTQLLNKGAIKVKKKKTFKKTTNNKNYKNFLKRRNELSMVKNPINTIINENINSIQSIDNLTDNLTSKSPVKLSSKLIEKPKISIKLPTEKDFKKVTVVENIKQPVFSFDRNKKIKNKKKSEMKKKSRIVSKKKTKRKSRKISFTVKKPKKNICDKFKKIKSDVETKDSSDMVNELKDKGISISGKSNKLLKDVYMCVMNDNINIKKE